MALLCKPLPIIDDIVGQLAARQEFVTNPSVVELATRLYFDPTTEQLRKAPAAKGAAPLAVWPTSLAVRRYVGPLRHNT